MTGSTLSRPVVGSGSYTIESTGKGGSSMTLKTSTFSPPTRLEADVWGGKAIHLNWDDNTDAEAHYRIDRWTRLGWRRGQYVPANATAAVMDNLVPGHATTYRVSAVTSTGESLRSANIVSAQTLNEDTSGWYKVKITQGMTKAFAGWDKEDRDDPEAEDYRGHADTLKVWPQYQIDESLTHNDESDWLYASSWQHAVWTALGSYSMVDGQAWTDPAKVRVTFDGGGYHADDTVYHNFPSGGDFKVGTGKDLSEDDGVEDFKLPASPTVKYIALEDSYKGIDRDYDDFYWQVEAEKLEIDVDIDSDNNNGTSGPDHSTSEDEIEDEAGSDEMPGKLIQSDVGTDADGDGVKDALDGWDRDGTSGNADDSSSHASYIATIDLPQDIDPDIVKLKLTFAESSLSDAASYSNGIRLWTSGAVYTKNKANVRDGGDYISPGEYTPAELKMVGRRILLNVEGIGASNSWADAGIKVEIDANGDGPGGFGSADEVTATIVDTRFTAYVVQPYTVQDYHRVFTQVDYTSPQSMKDSALYGFFHPDNDGSSAGWHGKSAWFGHAFAHLVYQTPDTTTAVDEYYGSTGLDQYLETAWHALWGDIAWFSYEGHRNTSAELAPWLANNNTIWTSYSAQTQTLGETTKLVQDHTWVVKPSVALDLYRILHPQGGTTSQGRNYSTYGLDLAATEGGCGTLVGLAMEAVGFTEQAGWKISAFGPVNSTIDQSQWGTADDADHDSLVFFDTGKMATWMRQSASTGTTYRNQESAWDGQRPW